jgi:hypothetical protein
MDKYEGITAVIEWITPELAREYLDLNFARNRSLLKTTSKNYADIMVAGDWKLCPDAVAFAINGDMVNGQHRLKAVIDTGLTQPFLVVRGFPPEDVTVFDLGKRRMMDERLTVAGCEIGRMECAIIRNALTTYEGSVIGTGRFSKPASDAYVWEQYQRHRCIINTVAGVSEFGLKVSSLTAAAAVKMAVCLYQPSFPGRSRVRPEFIADPMHAALRFIQIVSTGMLGEGMVPEDSAAQVLYKYMIERHARGQQWRTVNEYRISVSAAYAFMQGQICKTLKPRDADPFLALDKTFATTQVEEG